MTEAFKNLKKRLVLHVTKSDMDFVSMLSSISNLSHLSTLSVPDICSIALTIGCFSSTVSCSSKKAKPASSLLMYHRCLENAHIAACDTPSSTDLTAQIFFRSSTSCFGEATKSGAEYHALIYMIRANATNRVKPVSSVGFSLNCCRNKSSFMK